MKQSFDSTIMPGSWAYYACFSPTTEKYLQPEIFSAYTLSISLSWKLQRLKPKYHASQIAVNELQVHTRVFVFCFLSERKKNLTEKETEWKAHIDGCSREPQLWDPSMLQLEYLPMPTPVGRPQMRNRTSGDSKQWKRNFKTYDYFPQKPPTFSSLQPIHGYFLRGTPFRISWFFKKTPSI